MANNTTIAEEDQISHTQLIIVQTFTITTTVLGTVGNLMTILAIWKGKLCQNPSFIFILSLSVCNFVHSLFFHPLLLVQSIHNIWTNDDKLCNAYSYGLFSNLGTELWGYVCITFNRYFCVVYYHLYSRIYGNNRYNMIQVIFSWAFYHVLFLLPLFGIWGQFEYAPQKLVCNPFYGRNCEGFCIFTYTIAIGSTVPVIIYCYCAIIHKYMVSQRKVGLSRDRTIAMSISSEPQARVKKDSDKQRNLSELKMAFTILAVIIVFASCRLPFMILYVYDPAVVKVKPVVHTALIYMGSNSNWINPIIYAFTNKQIYSSLRKLLRIRKSSTIIENEVVELPKS